ncbi:M1 family metallopeptidase [Mucilaginibacter sp. AK015]|uniref:M1 family metallopeptidase n=1 Tax=Mucilaginibacter sp. AK015 TaxID=2723072 RepID=UPI00161BCF74|nr:M1 family metallopeptidase [Mucilaginibacter sp. AK015]MBB5396806.1 aminopeptidase N [Mucilaginibacter sp. AK015]
MKKILALVVLWCGASAALFAQSRDVSYVNSGGPLRPLQAIMDIRHNTLSLRVDIQKHIIDGYAEIDLVLSRATDTLLFDLVHLLTVNKTLVNGSGNTFKQVGDSVLIINKSGFKAGKQRVRIYYGGVPPEGTRPPWVGGFTWKTDTQGNPWVSINVQLQGAKLYYPCKDHPSDEPNEGVDLFITIPKGLSVAGPGLLQGVKAAKNNEATWHWKTNYTISNYTVVFNIGKYKVYSRTYTTVNGHKVPIQFYVLEQDTAQASKVLDMRVRDTRMMEKYYGEYPWYREKIGIAEVPNSGMEHQTMVTYSGKFKYDEYPGGLEFSGEMFHEYAHEWWANKVTNYDWSHMWIQEGSATYAEALFFLDKRGEAGYDSVMIRQRAGIRGLKPVIIPGQSEYLNSNYNTDMYSKGAFLLHTLRYVLGDSVFFPALKKFIVDVKYPYNKFFTTDEVERYYSAQSGKNLKPLFDFYLYTLDFMEFELVQTGPESYYLTIKNSPMDLPLDIMTDKGLLHTSTAGKTTRFAIKSKTIPVIDPRGWYYKKVTMR